MTDAQIETAARRYCTLLGLDPDEHVTLPSGDVNMTGPRWTAVCGDVRAALAMRQALVFAEEALADEG
jgi:hypothetical protein